MHPDHPGEAIEIMIGGNGARRTLRTLARYGDICNVRGTPEEVAQMIGVIRGHCEDAGRDPSEITLTTVMRPALVDEQHKIDRLRQVHGDGHDGGAANPAADRPGRAPGQPVPGVRGGRDQRGLSLSRSPTTRDSTSSSTTWC